MTEYFKADDSGLRPGADWNALVAVQRQSTGEASKKLSVAERAQQLGAFVGAASALVIHCGMLEMTAARFVRATEPPFSPEEATAFNEGVMSQYSVATSLELAARAASQGGN